MTRVNPEWTLVVRITALHKRDFIFSCAREAKQETANNLRPVAEDAAFHCDERA